MSTDTGTDTGSKIYAALADRLRRSIQSGVYRPGQLLGSEHSLARQEAISRMTVRRASELLVKEGLIERRPGKGLFVRDERATTRAIQVVAGNLQWEPSLQASRGIQSVAADKGVQTQLYDAHGDAAMDLAMLRQLPESDFAGAVIVSLHSKTFNEAIFDLHRQRFPFVLVDQKFHDLEIPAVTADNHGGGLQAGQHLLAHGHRRIGFIGDLVAVTVRDRLMGLRDAVADAGLPFDRSLVIDLCEDRDQDRLGDWSAEVAAATRQLMQRDDPPTAIFFSCDAVARAGCRALQAMGLAVPEDVSIVGFDDDPLCQWMTPGLTTIHQPFFEMGETAIQMLCERMVDPDAEVAPQVLPVTLIERASVADARPGH